MKMKISVKAALLSALAFPGCGHLILKRYVTAIVLVGISMVCIYLILNTTMQIAEDIVAKIQNGEIPLDANQIESAMTKAEQSNGHWWADLTTYVLGICWLIGIVDSYRVGQQQERVT
jgi:hypothetical protein